MNNNKTGDALPPINFTALAEALLQMADTVVPDWLPGGVRKGHEWVCGSLAGEPGTSCSVNLITGAWADFADHERGNDLLSLFAAIHGLTQAKAAVQLARIWKLEDVAGLVKTAGGAAPAPVANPRPAPPPKAQPVDKETWNVLAPVPAHAPPPTFRHFSRQPEDLVHTAAYVVDGALYGYVLRYRTSDGGKDTLPYTYCQSERDGGQKWVYKQWPEPRPLFFPSGQWPAGRTVILVEGEVKAQVLQAVLDAAAPGVYCVASWAGGCKAWAKADWAWLAGTTVLGWPDCDAHREPLSAKERAAVKGDDAARKALQDAKPLLPAHRQPGMAAQLGILSLLRDTHGCTVTLLPIPAPGEVPSGWDCKDAIETDGWTPEQVLAFLGRAQPLPAVDAAAAAEKKSRPPVSTQGAGDAGFDDLPPGDGDDDDWVQCGSRKVPRWLSYYWDAEKERWNLSRKAVIACLERDPALRGVVAFNELTNTVQCRRAWPWPHAKAGDVRSVDGLLLGKYLSETYGLPSVSKANLEEAIQTVAHVERYHPIREWMLSLQWDGQLRIDKWLVHALGESPQSLTPQRYEYLSLVGRYWLLGMVWRVMEPGCKFDYCPVLEGVGGLRKSTLVEVLAGAEYFSDTPFDMSRGKEAQEQVQGVWGYEIAELAALSKADVNAIKAFISSKVDRYRVAYGTTVESFPRQCVLTGTTNDDTYLRDRTGNRRFWPVPVRHVINTDWVQRPRGQLFAEAFALYLQGVAYTPSADEEKRLFAPMQDSRLIETAVESELLRMLTRPPGLPGDTSNINVDTAFVTLARLVQALGADVAKATPGLESQIRGWLKQAGWERDKVQINGVRANGYVRPAQWPPQDPDAAPPPDAPVPAPAGPGGQPLEPTGAQAAQWDGDIDADDLPF